MFLRSAAAFFCCALLLVAHNPSVAQDAARPAQDTQIMDWVFAMPEGWRVANSRLTLLTTKLLALEHTERCSDHLTQVTFGRPGTFEGTFEKWFDGHWKQLNKDYTFLDPDKPESSELADGYKAIAGVGVAQMDNGKTRVVMLVGLNKNTTAGVMCFITEDLEHFEANTARMTTLLDSARFASQRGKNEPAPKLRVNIDPNCTPSITWNKTPVWPKGDGALEGMWGRWGMVTDGYYMDGFGNYWPKWRTGYYYLVFFKDGTMTTRMPPEGGLGLDVPFMRLEFPDYFGTYTVKGDQVTVTTGPKENPTVKVYTLSGDELKHEAAVFRPLRKDAPVLKGRYMMLEWESRQPEFRKGITFAEDGTFDDEGFNSMLHHRWWCGDWYWLVEQGAEPGKGKWTIRENTLELVYTDGRKLRYGFHVHQNEADKKSYLVVNSKFMDKVD